MIDSRTFRKLSRPTQIHLQVGGCMLHLMRKVDDARGSLTVGEAPTQLPFAPQRYFIVFNVPSDSLRGAHAHRLCQQFLVCVRGSCQILLDDGKQRCELTLDTPDVGVFVPELIWGTQHQYSSDAALMVLASRTYEPEDYIHTYDEFVAERAKLDY